MRVGSPSFVMWMSWGMQAWLLFSFLVALRFSLYSESPIGMTSVLFMLNLAPDALHHFESICWRLLKLSSLDTYTVVSSANRVVIIFFLHLGMLYPCIADFLSISARGSMAKLNSMQD